MHEQSMNHISLKKIGKLVASWQWLWNILGMRIMCLKASTCMEICWLDEMVKCGQNDVWNPLLHRHVVLHLLSFISLLSKVNCSGADAQVVSCHCYPIVFHHFVEQLAVFYISKLVLYLVFYPKTQYCDGTMSGLSTKICKLCVNLYILTVKPLQTDRHTNTTSE